MNRAENCPRSPSIILNSTSARAMPTQRVSVLPILASIEKQSQRLVSEGFRGSINYAVLEEDREKLREDPELEIVGENEHEMEPLVPWSSRGPSNEKNHLGATASPFESKESSVSRLFANSRDDLANPSAMPCHRGVCEDACSL